MEGGEEKGMTVTGFTFGTDSLNKKTVTLFGANNEVSPSLSGLGLPCRRGSTDRELTFDFPPLSHRRLKSSVRMS